MLLFLRHRFKLPGRLASALLRNREGGIAIMAALFIPIVIGFSALSIEYGYSLLIRDRNQRAADLASYAAAVAYNSTNSLTAMNTAGVRTAQLNGLNPGDITVSLATSPKDASAQAVYAVVNTTNQLILAPILGASSSLNIAASAYASVGAASTGCIIALDPAGTGITLSGGVQVGAPKCKVQSNNTIVAPCGTKITAESASYYLSSPQPCQWTPNIVQADGTAAPTTNQLTTDPLAANAGVKTLTARFDTIRSASWPSAVSVNTNPDIEFGGSASPPTTAAAIKAAGCSYDTSYYNQYWTSVWVVSCAGPYVNVGNLLVHGNLQVSINAASTQSITYNFSGRVQNDNGTSLSFGPGTFNVAGGIYGAKLTFGAGTFNVGKGTVTCGDGLYSLCSSGTLTFGGPSDFSLNAGLYVGGGSTMTLGSGTSNSYIIGASSTGNSISLSGGASAYLADANGNSDNVFRTNGVINGGGGGSCLTLPAAKQHDISGSVNLAGGAVLGAGVYTVDGYLSVNTGGSSCSAAPAVSGTNVSIALSGITTANASGCIGKAFCLTGGNQITLTAPTSGTYANLAVVGPQSSSNTAGAEITSGGQGKIAGAFYFPNGKIDLGGGGTIGDTNLGCLEMIGSSVSLSAGAQTMSECKLSTGGGAVALIQ
jgi:Flp pilus assembly protein TadG